MTPKMHRQSQTGRSADHHRVDVLGPLALVLLVFVTARLGLGALGLAWATPAAVGITALAVLGWIMWRAWRQRRLADKHLSLSQQLHDLKEQEFQLRLKEARMNGQLDRWSKSEGAE